MRVFRRIASAILLGVLFVGGLRLSGSSGTPEQRGGWQPLVLPPSGGGAHDRG